MTNPLQNFREKYPQYGDVDDATLGNMLAAKYPDSYGDLAVNLGTADTNPHQSQPTETAFSGDQHGPGSGETEQKQQSLINTPQAPQEPGFTDSVKSDFNRRTQEVSQMIDRQKTPLVSAPITAMVTAAESVGMLGDVAAEGISRVYKNVVSENKQEEVKEAFRRLGETSVGKIGIDAFQKGTEEFAKFEKWNPDAALAIKSMLNMLGGSMIPKPTTALTKKGIKATAMTAKEAKHIVDDFVGLTRKEIDPTDMSGTLPIVSSGYPKSVGLKTKHVKADKHIDNLLDNANLAVRTIIDNIDNIKIPDGSGGFISGVPTTLREFSQAIGSTKEILFKQYDDIARKAGQTGAKVEIDPLASELLSLSKDKGMTTDIRKYAKQQYDELLNDGPLSTMEAQTRVKVLNNKLGTILDYQSSPHRVVDSLIRNNLRKGLNNVVESLDGTGSYANFKKQYGALRSIEEDVSKKAMQFANKKEKGFIDYSDIFTHSELAAGIATLSPVKTIKGATGIGLKMRYKFLNDPNNAVKSMFKNSESVMKGESYKPKSFLLKNMGKKDKVVIDVGLYPLCQD